MTKLSVNINKVYLYPMIERKSKRIAKIGVFAVAHATYWGQFEGLFDNIMGYHNDLCEKIKKYDVEIADFGMIDSSEKAYEAIPEILSANVDVLFCNMVTYDHATADRLVPKELEKRSAYDGLAEGSTVCSGYALLFQRFMERLDIPCKYYTGYIRGGAHAWNIVYLDGLWYHIDCTWADQSWGISYSYFLIGTDRMGYPENGYAMAPTRYPY